MKSLKTNKPNAFKVKSIDIQSCEYPPLLKKIKAPPAKLYFRGIWNQDMFKDSLSVVGSRAMTGYGEIITERLVTAAASENITIISGFMYGIDAAAHEAALDADGITVAVMPCGIERIHPLIQEKLYMRILKNRGMVISEFEGDMKPARWSFPRRNRIIAGLSPALLVIEAGLKSGALITANYAYMYKRQIFAVPGPITSSVSLGTVNLIKQGASLVSSAEDILNHYGKFSLASDTEIISHTASGKNQLTESAQKSDDMHDIGSDINTGADKSKCIYTGADTDDNSAEKSCKRNCIIQLLEKEALSMDEIIRKSSLSAAETGAEITRLQIRRKILLKEGLYYPAGRYKK